jgi:alkylation response protein AidB-like acyl-CoA dehydrogenase
MISFQPTEEQQSVREAMRDFAAQAMRGTAREYDEASAVPDSFLAQAWELGLTATQIAESYGGYGAERSPLTNAIVLEELAFGDATLAAAAVAPSLFAYAVLDQGSDEQRKAFLPAFTGDQYRTASVAIAEPAPDFNAFAPSTRARRDNGSYILDGKKCFVPMGERASHFLVVAGSDAGLDAFIVPRDAPGVTVSEVEKNLGLRALPTVSLELRGVTLPLEGRLGGPRGADVARLINRSRVGLAAVMTGLSRAVLEYCVPYSKERVAFDEPIARKQSIAFRLAEMHIEIECTRWLVWKAASELEKGADATRSAHQARAYAAEKSMWIADNGVQVLGGHGFIREHPVEMWYRNARTLGVLESLVSV